MIFFSWIGSLPLYSVLLARRTKYESLYFFSPAAMAEKVRQSRNQNLSLSLSLLISFLFDWLVGWLVVFFFFLFCFFFTTWPPALQLGSKNSIFMFKQKNLTLKDTSALVYINSTHLYSVQVLKRNQIFLNLMQNIHELRKKNVLSLFFHWTRL